MDRRSVLKTVSILVGGSLSAGAVTAIMSGCQPSTSDDWSPSLFSNKQLKLVGEIAETILPQTDTPGAKELNVHRYIDEVLAVCHSEATQKKIVEGLENINSASKSVSGKDFVDASIEERLASLNAYDKEAFGENGREHFFRTLKTLTLAGFFSTEIGQTQVLQHSAVPGKYIACAPLSEIGNGKTWAQ